MKRYLSIFIVFAFVCLLWVGRMQMKPASADKQSENRQKVVLDAGHGGFDPGKVGINDILEKDINLQIAKKLKIFLEKNNIEVIMTRTSDEGLYKEESTARKTEDMRGRCTIIEKEKPVCTISIHQNSFTDTTVRGPQVFYYHSSKEGKYLAEVIQAQLNEKLEIAKPREIKENDTYYILKKSTSVTALVECGFISNPQEADLLATEDYQERVAEAIGSGIIEYLS